jgi:hypothetical protein
MAQMRTTGRFWRVVISGATARIRGVRMPPEGHCGFEPLHLSQATGFAGNGEFRITGIMGRSWLWGVPVLDSCQGPVSNG